eukprot:1186926-Prorocentrum_minimum.AAC.2
MRSGTWRDAALQVTTSTYGEAPPVRAARLDVGAHLLCGDRVGRRWISRGRAIQPQRRAAHPRETVGLSRTLPHRQGRAGDSLVRPPRARGDHQAPPLLRLLLSCTLLFTSGRLNNKHVLQELSGRLYLPMSQKSAH